jgi:carbon starvation protein
MLLLAIGIIVVHPNLKMPAVTKFIDGTGPVWSGSLFPFLFITIACGAVSGFHALIASGTTPKLLENENQARFIGYGGMLTESFVAIMAMIGATVLEPGVYFAMNSPAGLIGKTASEAAQVVSGWGFSLTPEMITQLAQDVGEKTLLSRTGGAPTLAVGMASILSGMFGGRTLMGIWYHFAILFEALFILTTVDAGTRVARFMIQDVIGGLIPSFRRTDSWANTIIGSALAVGAWGYFLFQGVIDPMGGINTLWPLFGISNQMLAGIALILCTVVLIKMKRQRYIWVTAIPTLWLLTCTLTAGLQKLLSSVPAIGFLSHARLFVAAADAGRILPPAKTLEEMNRIIFNDYVDAALAALFIAVLLAVALYGVMAMRKALADPKVSAVEVGVGAVAGATHA